MRLASYMLIEWFSPFHRLYDRLYAHMRVYIVDLLLALGLLQVSNLELVFI
jgi:hypothetical protein